MILSGEKIKESIREGLFAIDPFVEKNIKGASYTFTLDTKILSLAEGQVLRVDVKPKYEESFIPKEGYVLQPAQCILGFTREKLTLKGMFACFLSTRGSSAQIGLHVLLGSAFAEPDTDNIQILEIVNVSKSPILLLSGMPIVKGVFMSVE